MIVTVVHVGRVRVLVLDGLVIVRVGVPGARPQPGMVVAVVNVVVGVRVDVPHGGVCMAMAVGFPVRQP